ncbi:hypothetical protein ACHAWF_016037 [Thalassiosira exigua]
MRTRPTAGVLAAAASAAAALLGRARPARAFAYVDGPDAGVPRMAGPSPSSSSAAAASPDPELIRSHADFASLLADAAREEILPYWRSSRHALGQEIKVEEDRSVFQSASPVTLADRAAERAMRDLIGERFPDHGIYGEEYGVKDADADWVWVLDPIDGTRSFITGKPLFGTLVSLLYKGRPVVGVIDQCVLDERWVGIAGRPSTLNGEPIRTDGVSTLSEAEMYSTTPDMFQLGDESSKFDAMRRAVRAPHYGADCYAYALVASGFGADVVVEADLGLYDYCALVPVIEGAGGVISDWTGAELTLGNHEKSRGRVVASANRSLHAQALEILNAVGPTTAPIPVEDELLAALDGIGIASTLPKSRDVTPLLCGVMLGEVIAHLAP